MPENRPFKPFGVMIGPDGEPLGTVAYGWYVNPDAPVIPVDPGGGPPPIDPPPVVIPPPTVLNVSLRGGFAGNVLPENTLPGTIIADLSSDVTPVSFNDVTDLDGKFNVVGTTLRLFAALDYETKTSHNVTLRALGDGGQFDRTLAFTVSDYDEVGPTITSLNTLTVQENAAFTHTLTANETATWAIVGGADSVFFSLAGSTLSMTAKDFENAQDAGANNTYVVQVTATDANGNVSAPQTITVTVQNVSELAAPTQVTPPTIINTSPEVGQTFNSSSYTRGGYAGNPATFIYTDTLKINNLTRAMPYTFVTGDIGLPVTVNINVNNGVAPPYNAVSNTAVVVAASTVPSGSVLASSYNAATATPYWSGGPHIWLWGYPWDLDSPRQSWSFSSNNLYGQFEIRQSDPLFTKPGFSDTAAHRDKLVLTNSLWYGPTFKFRAIGKITYLAGVPTTTSFWTHIELHTFGSAFMLAAMFEIFNRQGKFGVSANYNPTSSTTATRTLWDYSIPGPNGALTIVQGQTYNVDIYVAPDPTGSTGRVRVAIDGVVYVNFTGKVGFINTTQVAPEIGSYRGPITAAETGIIRHEWTTLQWSAGLTDPDAGGGETLGSDLAGGRNPFTSATGLSVTNATAVYNSGAPGVDVTNTVISAYNTFATFVITTTALKRYKAVLVARNVTSNNFYLALESGATFVASDFNPATSNVTVTLYIDTPAASTTTQVYFNNESISASKTMKLVSFTFQEVL